MRPESRHRLPGFADIRHRCPFSADHGPGVPQWGSERRPAGGFEHTAPRSTGSKGSKAPDATLLDLLNLRTPRAAFSARPGQTVCYSSTGSAGVHENHARKEPCHARPQAATVGQSTRMRCLPPTSARIGRGRLVLRRVRQHLAVRGAFGQPGRVVASYGVLQAMVSYK